jgi:hypothetical protein
MRPNVSRQVGLMHAVDRQEQNMRSVTRPRGLSGLAARTAGNDEQQGGAGKGCPPASEHGH